MKASDVMIWHVPNGETTSQIAEKAYLKYFTTDGFLSQYGGTLRDLYKSHFLSRPHEGVYSLS